MEASKMTLDSAARPGDGTHERSAMVALNADVVGYSRLVADDVEAMTATMEAYRALVEHQVREAAGRLVNFVGDSFMAVFGHATDAMRAAIAITTEIETRNAGRPGSSLVRFRMGLDQGPITHAGDEIFGDALNISSRIQTIARPGGISVSARVYRALDEPALRFRPIGRPTLKGIPEAVDIYEFVDLPTEGSSSPGARPLALDEPTVAVLPIHAESVDETVRATAELGRMELIHRLARTPHLKVVDARSEPTEGAAQDTARYMIETGIHQAGEDLRVYATVFDVTTMNVVKSHKWSLKASDLFARSEQLADDVARSVEVDLIIGEPAGLYAELTTRRRSSRSTLAGISSPPARGRGGRGRSSSSARSLAAIRTSPSATSSRPLPTGWAPVRAGCATRMPLCGWPANRPNEGWRSVTRPAWPRPSRLPSSCPRAVARRRSRPSSRPRSCDRPVTSPSACRVASAATLATGTRPLT
jgi:class 3 adenylate cyclase/TolB-like protein